MQPQTEVKPEEKNTQQQNPEVAKSQVPAQDPNAPVIKSEENQANWKAFREKREIERKEAEEAKKRAAEKQAEAEALKAALAASLNRQSNDHQLRETASDGNEESEEQRIERKVAEAIKQHEDKRKQLEQQRAQQELPQRLAYAYSDFEKVCSQENLDYLEFHYPEITRPFKQIPESFESWSDLYKAMKRLIPNADSSKDQKKAETNLKKPGALSAPGTTQGGNAMGSARLDEAKKAANWERMQRTLKGLS